MLEDVRQEFSSPPGRAIGATFRRVGWIGFWAQVVVAIAPLLVMALVFGVARGFAVPGARAALLSWLSLIGVAILLFTTFWSWRYTRIGRRLEAGGEAADATALSRTVWIGLGASAAGVLLSVTVMLAEIIWLFLVFLEAPQGGAPVFQTTEGAGPAWISALDVLSLLALILTAAAEILTLLLGLWLLHRLSGAASRAADAALADTARA
jgi:hypothetical protein